MDISKAYCSFLWLYIILVAFQCNADVANQTSSLIVDASQSGRPIPNTFMGVFFEEINHAGAGGVWAELVSNRGRLLEGFAPRVARTSHCSNIPTWKNCFEIWDNQDPSNIANWTRVGEESSVKVETELSSCFERNKVAARIDVLCDKNNCPPGGVGISNPGYWGMNIVQGKKYNVVFYVHSSGPLDMTVSFKTTDGGILATKRIKRPAKKVSKWTKVKTTLVAIASSAKGTLHLTTTQKGKIWLDQVSAMPADTFKGHGFRSDLATMIADLKPAFFRFPGGCYVEGVKLRNAFKWKDTVGPWENRPGHLNDVWNYWTDDGLGYFEGLQLAEDIGAKPVWVFNNGIAHREHVPPSELKPWLEDALDGIEFARGPADSKWGSLRASMGHPEPFDLKYVTVGNEDCGYFSDPVTYQGNYMPFFHAIRNAYPDMQIITNCEAPKQPVNHPADLYEYHTYPDNARNMFNNAHVFDKMPRNGPKAFVSEYGLGKAPGGHGTLLGGVSEAGFLIGLEENSDLVVMVAYAPLLVNVNDRGWDPDAINFDSSQAYGTPSYWVTYMFKESNGATFLNSTLQGVDTQSFAASVVRLQNPQTNNTYLKIKVANFGSAPVNLKISLKGLVSSNLTQSTKTVLTSGNPMDENNFANPKKITPQQSKLENPGNEMNVIIPPVSFTVFDLL